jgi:hypothetical protein
MADANNRFKKIAYNYDLISGKVNSVAYQPGQVDPFYHEYNYDEITGLLRYLLATTVFIGNRMLLTIITVMGRLLGFCLDKTRCRALIMPILCRAGSKE